MKKRRLFNAERLSITLRRLCAEIMEQHPDPSDLLLIGLQPKGVFLARRLSGCLELLGYKLPLGMIDATFHRDDIHTSGLRKAYPTSLEGGIESKNVILVDDVLYTGRTVRAALDAILSYGRPRRVELLVLIDRIDRRDLPIEANYVGCRVNTLQRQYIELRLVEQNNKEDGIWIVQDKI